LFVFRYGGAMVVRFVCSRFVGDGLTSYDEVQIIFFVALSIDKNDFRTFNIGFVLRLFPFLMGASGSKKKKTLSLPLLSEWQSTFDMQDFPVSELRRSLDCDRAHNSLGMPLDVLCKIASCLEAQEIGCFALVCKTWR
jgi:hypothetical protein